jgi:sulfatase maturation enzyme AslB (radical SAM superfamily)
MIERLSIELTQRCSKACWFCYSGSTPLGSTRFERDELLAFVGDCAANGVRAVSFGGGEPLEYEPVFSLLRELEGILFRSLTTNGLLLDGPAFEKLVAARPDKVHVSIHFPNNVAEVERVTRQVGALGAAGIRSGVNLLVSRANAEHAEQATRFLHEHGIGNDRIVFLPMRIKDTPAPSELARVAGSPRFQSMSCLLGCARSPRFCAIGWDKSVAHCSYTSARRPLEAPTYAALMRALDGLTLAFCGGTDEGLVRLSRRA